MEKTIEIPEGYEARIEGNKVILKPKESEDEKIRKELLVHIQQERASSTLEVNYAKWDRMIAWLEKQGSQNLANSEKTCKVEPKSADKVEAKQNSDIEKGKWYVCDTPRYADFAVGKAYYCPKSGMLKPNENEMALYVAKYCFHLWTIQDAKDGDVLVASDHSIFILKDVINKDCICYIALSTDNTITLEDYWEVATAVLPATKEQRELLFQKMKDVGYEWDAEKKKLKKIEQNPAWSEADENRLKVVISFVNSNPAEDPFYDKGCLKDWLKSLKERYTWKPSDEQMTALSIIKDSGNSHEHEVLDSLYYDLKKLIG